MDVPNFVGSKYRPRSKFAAQTNEDSGMAARELLHRVLEVVDRFPDARDAVRLELERLSEEDDEDTPQPRPLHLRI